MARILCTGGAGYLGSVLVPMLLDAGHHVTVLDNFAHGIPSLTVQAHNPRLEIVRGDARNLDTVRPLLARADAVVPLAAVVGAPACDRDPETARTLNLDAVHAICFSLSGDQVIVFPNTNSGYGTGGEEECTEDSPMNPVSLYGKLKVCAESDVLDTGRGVSMRFATLFGASPRMRIDLMVNDFTFRAVRDRALVLFEPQFRRNFLHVRDAASAILWALEGKLPPGPCNVGDSRANMTKAQLCGEIARIVPGFGWYVGRNGVDPDRRDYIVSNAKIEGTGWRPKYMLQDGIRELVRCYAQPFEAYRNA